MSNKNIITVIGATITASLCCVTPILAVLAGSSTLASSFSWLAPYHNYLVGFTLLVLVYAWYDKFKLSTDIDCACDTKKSFWASKTFLAIVTFFSVLMLTFPQWGNTFFDVAPSAESCASGHCESTVSSTAKPFKNVTETSVVAPSSENALTVYNYMQEEKVHPTTYKHVACSGTGLEDLDRLMAKKRALVEEMPPPVLKKILDNEDDVVLLDVRELSHQDGGEIEVFESHALTYGKLLFNVVKELQDKDAVIVVYSKLGLISLFAASTLKEFGYKNMYSLQGGVKAWKLAGYPYEKED